MTQSEVVGVGCDICGRRYNVKPEKLGVSVKCRECGVPFTMVESPPFSEEENDLDEPSLYSKVCTISGHVGTSLVIFLGLGVMLRLCWIDPHSTGLAMSGSSPVSQSRSQQSASPTPASALPSTSQPNNPQVVQQSPESSTQPQISQAGRNSAAKRMQIPLPHTPMPHLLDPSEFPNPPSFPQQSRMLRSPTGRAPTIQSPPSVPNRRTNSPFPPFQNQPFRLKPLSPSGTPPPAGTGQ